MNPIKARVVIAESIALLENTGIRWWASSGTVLGLIRESLSDAWLTKDTDWDISVWGAIKEREFISEVFLAAGFSVHRAYDIDGSPVQMCLEKSGVWVDFYFWTDSEREPDLLICNCEHGQMIKLKRFGEQRWKHQQTGLWIPGPVREYLFWRYGCDWHIPKTSKGNWEMEAPHLRRGPAIISTRK